MNESSRCLQVQLRNPQSWLSAAAAASPPPQQRVASPTGLDGAPIGVQANAQALAPAASGTHRVHTGGADGDSVHSSRNSGSGAHRGSAAVLLAASAAGVLCTAALVALSARLLRRSSQAPQSASSPSARIAIASLGGAPPGRDTEEEGAGCGAAAAAAAEPSQCCGDGGGRELCSALSTPVAQGAATPSASAFSSTQNSSVPDDSTVVATSSTFTTTSSRTSSCNMGPAQPQSEPSCFVRAISESPVAPNTAAGAALLSASVESASAPLPLPQSAQLPAPSALPLSGPAPALPCAAPPPATPCRRSLSASSNPRPVLPEDAGSSGTCSGSLPLSASIPLNLQFGTDIEVEPGRVLGCGGVGRVLVGRCRGQRVAVKLMKAPTWRSAQQGSAAAAVFSRLHLLSFISELEVLMGRCCHPNVVTLLGACKVPPHLCLVMELMEQSLARKMADVGGLLLMEEVLQIATDMAQGLAYLHPTVTHCNLKPANVLLDRAGTAKLSDFGMARLRGAGAPSGTPDASSAPYSAPECFEPNGGRFVSPKADIYSWAVVVWEMLSGSTPWAGYHAMDIAVAVQNHERPPLAELGDERCPYALQGLLADCWDSNPDRRPSAKQVLERLEAVRAALLDDFW